MLVQGLSILCVLGFVWIILLLGSVLLHGGRVVTTRNPNWRYPWPIRVTDWLLKPLDKLLFPEEKHSDEKKA